MYQAPPGVRSLRELQVRYIKQRSQELGDLPTNMGGMAKNGQPIGKITYSLFWALFKAEYIYLFATPHWLTRIDRKLEKLRPERMLAGRQKFEAYRIWIKTHLADSIRHLVESPRTMYAVFRQGIRGASRGAACCWNSQLSVRDQQDVDDRTHL